jgi:hypothetical protein
MPRQQKSTADKPAKAAPAKSADKRPTVEKRVEKAVEKRAPVEKRPAARTARQSDAPHSNGRDSNAQVDLNADEMHRLIQEAAYFKAKARNFAPGHEVQDWIEAESEVRLRFDAGSRREGRSA